MTAPLTDRTESDRPETPSDAPRFAARPGKSLIPAQRRATTGSSGNPTPASTAAVAVAPAMIRAVWNADCSATVELARLAGPRTGLWRLPRRLAHPPCDTSPCDLGRAGHKAALYQRCLTIGTQFDIYTWLNLADLAQLWHLLVLPPGLKTEWAGALRSAGLLRNHARREPAHAQAYPDVSAPPEPPLEVDRLLTDLAAASIGDDQGPRRRAESAVLSHTSCPLPTAPQPISVVVTSTQTIWNRRIAPG